MPPRRAVGGRRPGRARRQPVRAVRGRVDAGAEDVGLEDEASSAAARDARTEPVVGRPRDIGVDDTAQGRVGDDGRPPVIPPIPPRVPPEAPRVAPPGTPPVEPIPPPAVPAPGVDTTIVLQQMLAMQTQTVRLLDILQHQAEARGAVVPIAAPAVDYLELASRHRPSTFSGSSDPVVFDNWAYEMERIFEYISCPPERQVLVATRYFGDAALHWWRTRERDLTAEPGFGWEQLTRAMRLHFFTPETLNAKRREFLALRQRRDQTAHEYYERFIELMRYAPEVVPTEEDKVRMYIDGLLAETRAAYNYTSFPTLTAACDSAMFLERGRTDLQRFAGRRRDRDGADRGDRRPAQFRRRDDQGHARGRGRDGDGPRGRADDRGRAPVADGARVEDRDGDERRRLRCWECGERGHVRARCPRAGAQPGVPRDDGRGGDRVPRGRAGRLNVVQRADAERREDVLAG